VLHPLPEGGEEEEEQEEQEEQEEEQTRDLFAGTFG